MDTPIKMGTSSPAGSRAESWSGANVTKNGSFWTFVMLHAIVFLWGASGLVGDEVHLSAYAIVFLRMLLAVPPLFVYLRLTQKDGGQGLAWQQKALCMASGLCLSLHWWCFFEAIKSSTVSIGLICLSAGPFFIALLEPLLGRSRIRPSELLMGSACVASLAMIFKFESQYAYGIVVGVMAALLDACYSMMTSRLVRKHSSLYVSFLQMCGGAIVFGLGGWLYHGSFSWLMVERSSDLWGLLFLGLVCTAFAMTVYNHCLRTISAFSAVLAINLEPVYGIVLALILYGEKEVMSVGFYVGATMLFASIALDSILKHRDSVALRKLQG